MHKGLPYAETVTRRTTLATRCHKANRLACTYACIRAPCASNNKPLLCCRSKFSCATPRPSAHLHIDATTACIARHNNSRLQSPINRHKKKQLESCTSGGVGDGAAVATLLLGTSIARDSKRKLYTLRPLAPMLLPTRHKFGTAADDPRHYQPGKHVTCAHTRAFVHAMAFMQHEPCSPRASTPI